MARPRLHDAELARRLVERSAAVVNESGVQHLSLRSLASAEGTSTSAIYSLFGNKAGLLSAIFDAASDSFGATQSAVGESDDPVADVIALGHAYRHWSLANPHLFHIMFGDVLAEYELTEEQLATCEASVQPLVTAVVRGLEAGLLEGPAEVIIMTSWSIVQGFVSLELSPAGKYHGAQSAELFDQVAKAGIRGWAAPRLRVP